jgi:hypothetical protein
MQTHCLTIPEKISRNKDQQILMQTATALQEDAKTPTTVCEEMLGTFLPKRRFLKR